MTPAPTRKRVLVTGAAGLVGQNLFAALQASDRFDLVGVDKNAHNLAILRGLHPERRLIEADLAEAGAWEAEAAACDVLVLLHAQIGGLQEAEFIRNNIESTRRVLDAVGSRRPYVVHVSSSVVNSQARDFYTETKKAQERVVLERGLACAVLRPTLMFGWFDRKHLGWLARFMERTPVFPIPGDGRYLRQPLFAGDFSAMIVACLEREIVGAYNISGLEQVDYADLMREVRSAVGARAPIVHIPYRLFEVLLATYAMFDRNPPFTTSQLRALVTPDVFEVIDWPGVFGVAPTPLRDALRRTFRDPRYAKLRLQF